MSEKPDTPGLNANDQCSKCDSDKDLSDIKISNQDLGKLCKKHFEEFQKTVIETFKNWVKQKA